MGKKPKIILDNLGNCGIILTVPAGVAHLVERHLAKVEVASSSLVTRSIKAADFQLLFFLPRQAGLERFLPFPAKPPKSFSRN